MDVMTLEDISKTLHISLGTARNRLSSGCSMPPSFRVGRRRLFLRSEVDAWLKKQIFEQCEEASMDSINDVD